MKTTLFAFVLCASLATAALAEEDPLNSAKVIFVTAQTFAGNFGGSQSGSGVYIADEICQSAAQTGRIRGVFRALLLDASGRNSLRQVLKAHQLYTRPNGTVIGTTFANSMLPSVLTHPISAASTNVWTGMDANGNVTAKNCRNWTDGASDQDTGMAGVAASAMGSGAVSTQALDCHSTAALYCVQQ